MNKRIFLTIKINPEPELLDLFDLLRDELIGEQIKWVDEDQLHMFFNFVNCNFSITRQQFNYLSGL